MSLEQVLEIEVSTVSRVPEETATIPAAIFVITQEDIRRSGANSIPELLRLAPGLQVARIDGGAWSIGIRGFADRLARSMLVLIDGRAVYSPLFAGTYWETQDPPLEEIDRIEIIRGPGGTLWGANAVNGIVNIITKPAKDTQGLAVQFGAGSEDRARADARYGWSSKAASARAYVHTIDRGAEFHADGDDYDGWRAVQGGMRADWTLPQNRTLTVQGDVYDGRLGERSTATFYSPPFVQTANLDAPLSGGNVLARFEAKAAARGDYRVQAYYDRTNRHEIPVSEDRDTADIDYQQTARWQRQTMTCGAGYRVTSGRIDALPPTAFSPATRTDNLYSAFLQDEVAVVPGRWRLTVGSKFEHNAYSGFEMQPSVRAAWTPDRLNTFWGAVTRAVRTPSRVETDYTTVSLIDPALPTFVRLLPNPSFDSEKLRAYEFGYRARPIQQLYLTASLFYNDLEDTLSTELLAATAEDVPPDPRRLVFPVQFGNGLHGHTDGVELTGDWRVGHWWRLTSNYSYLAVGMTKDPGGHDVSQELRYEGGSPHHQVQVGSSFDLGRWSIDWQWRHVSRLVSPAVPAYSASTIRVGWRPTRALELSLVGQDLFEAHHFEWPSAGGNVEIGRSVFAGVTWKR